MERLPEETMSTIPVFICKLWDLVGSGRHGDLIGWSAGGRSVIIQDTYRFAKDLLPLYFKHNHMDSFTRQLNTYGFRNGMDDQHDTGMKRKCGEIIFHHPHFLMGQADLLTRIKRKRLDRAASSPVGQKELAVTTNKDTAVDLMAQVTQRQDSLQDFMMEMEKENSSIWREIAMLRHRSAKQKAVAQQIIQFLVPNTKTRNKVRKRSTSSLIHPDLSSSSSKRVKSVATSCVSNLSSPDVLRFGNQFRSNAPLFFEDCSKSFHASDHVPGTGLIIPDTRKDVAESTGDHAVETEDVSLYQKELSEFVEDTSALFGVLSPSDPLSFHTPSTQCQVKSEVGVTATDYWPEERLLPLFGSADLFVCQSDLMFPVLSCPSPVTPERSMFDFNLHN